MSLKRRNLIPCTPFVLFFTLTLIVYFIKGIKVIKNIIQYNLLHLFIPGPRPPRPDRVGGAPGYATRGPGIAMCRSGSGGDLWLRGAELAGGCMLAVAVDGLDSRVSAAVLYRVSGDRCWPGGQRLGASLVHGAPGRGARERPAPRPSNDATALCAFFLVSCPTRIGHGSPFLPSFVLTVILVQYRLAVWAKDGRRVFFFDRRKKKEHDTCMCRG
jgi:hypothetical protein